MKPESHTSSSQTTTLLVGWPFAPTSLTTVTSPTSVTTSTINVTATTTNGEAGIGMETISAGTVGTSGTEGVVVTDGIATTAPTAVVKVSSCPPPNVRLT